MSRSEVIDVEVVDGVLAALHELVDDSDRERLDRLRRRAAERRLRLLVLGEAKRGKSTLINRLLGRDVLPTGVIPVTALPTTVRPARTGEVERVRLRFGDGHCDCVSLADLARYVTEQGNPNNERGVHDVEVMLDAPLLNELGVELVDTPGTGSVFEHNTTAAEQALATLDAAIVVVSADPPISAAERDLLARAAAAAVRLFVVLNKADQLAAPELAEAQAFTARVVTDATGAPADIYSCAARNGRADPGFARFADTLRGYLTERSAHDAAAAIRGHTAQLVSDLLDQAALTDRSLALTASSSAGQVDLFRSRLDALAARQQDIDDRCRAVERRMRRELDESARARLAALSRQVRTDTQTALDGPLGHAPADTLERDGRELAVRLIRSGVDAWRDASARRLEVGLGSLVESVAAELDGLLADLRAAARELFDVDVGLRRGDDLLPPSRAFRYDFEPGIGWELPFAGALRQALPGRAKRARAQLLGDIAELTDRQLGRARADLQQRLAGSVRMLIGSLHAEYGTTAGRVARALAQAAAISTAATGERARQQAALANRMRTLRGYRDLLRGDSTGAPAEH